MIQTLESANATEARKAMEPVCRVEFQPPRKSALAKIKIEAMRIGNNGTREGFKFAEKLFRALPELRNE